MLCRRFAVTQSDATPKRGVLFERYLVGFAVTQSDATPKLPLVDGPRLPCFAVTQSDATPKLNRVRRSGRRVLLLPRVTLLQNLVAETLYITKVLLLPRVTLLQNQQNERQLTCSFCCYPE